MCNGGCSGDKPKYKILSRLKAVDKDFWVVKYETWVGCYCTRKEKEAYVVKDSMPLMRDLLKVI